MVKYKGYGNIAITKYFVTPDEFTDIDNVLIDEALTPGDECWIEDSSTKTMISAHVYSGTGWRLYLNFNV